MARRLHLHASAGASGALLAVASAPGPFGPLAFVALVPAFRLLFQAPTPGCAAYAGFVVGLVHMAIGYGWALAASFRIGIVAALGTALVILALAAACGGLFAALAAVARRSPLAALAVAPGLWVAVEYARSQEWVVAAPWNHLGYALADHPALAAGAAYAGVYGLSFWIVATSAVLVALPRLGSRARAAWLCVLCLPALPGIAAREGDERDSVRVVAVQPHLSDAERRDPARFQINLASLIGLSHGALGAGADLVAWPESAYQRLAGARSDAFLTAIAHDLETPILTGVWSAPEAGRSWRNAAVLEPGDGGPRGVAEKRHLVAVYERAPGGPVSRALARLGLWSGWFEPGREGAPLALPRRGASAVPTGVLVCFDASFPELARGLRRDGARIVVAIANEVGTGAWSAALHVRATRLRAIENAVPIVRVANTGPSLWIDARGRIAASLPQGRAAAGAHRLALAGSPPPFVRIGERAVVGAAAALTALVIFAALSGPRAERTLRHTKEGETQMLHWVRTGLLAIALACAGAPAAATDGGSAAPPAPPPDGTDGERARAAVVPPEESYYEAAAAELGVSDGELRAASAAGLPTALHVVEATGRVTYRTLASGAQKVRIEMGERPHEQVDAVYDLVLALPLPIGFTSDAWRIAIQKGSLNDADPLYYAGERVRLKRNLPLESTWLPVLAGARDGLPDLAGSGYEWTFWDTIVRYDPRAGATVQGFGALTYEVKNPVEALDPEDPRNAAYLITWVPALDASVPPYTLRLDVAAP
jgi:apolipoprotein N-acyltransferase